MMADQLAFDLPVRPALGREDFFVSPSNATALATVEAWRDWPQKKLLLIGPEGAGKSHLVQVWAALSDARVLAASTLAPNRLPEVTAADAIAVEDVDGPDLDETALFHLHNLANEADAAILITARTPPRDWGLQLPDLASRLAAMQVARLERPDDALLRALILKQFADRQLTVSAQLIDFLANRIDRSFAGVKKAVDQLDAEALAEGKPVTRTLAARVLDKMGRRGA